MYSLENAATLAQSDPTVKNAKHAAEQLSGEEDSHGMQRLHRHSIVLNLILQIQNNYTCPLSLLGLLAKIKSVVSVLSSLISRTQSNGLQ